VQSWKIELCKKLVSALSAGAGMGKVARRIRRAEAQCGMLKYAIMLAFVISIGWFLTTLPLAQPYLSCLKTPVPDPNQDGFAAEFKRSVQCERMAFTDKLVRAFDPIDGRVGGLKTHDMRAVATYDQR
jgi:hypothetical protein